MMRYLVYHEQYGICLGYHVEGSYWSFLHPAGIDHAITFTSIAEAQRILTLLTIPEDAPLHYIPIVPDNAPFASRLICHLAGLPLWSPHPLAIH